MYQMITLQAGEPRLLQENIPTDWGTHPAYYSEGTGGFSSDIKWTGQKVDHSTPCNAEIKNEWSYSALTLCPHVMYRESFNFSLIEGQ
jgi:hypothetical protein